MDWDLKWDDIDSSLFYFTERYQRFRQEQKNIYNIKAYLFVGK